MSHHLVRGLGMVKRRTKGAIRGGMDTVGIEHRGVLAGLATGLLGVGGGMWLTTSVIFRLVGSLLIALSLVLFLSLFFGWPIRSFRIQYETVVPPSGGVSAPLLAIRERLRDQLEAAVIRGDHFATFATGEFIGENAHMDLNLCDEWADSTRKLLDAALGPRMAIEFVAAGRVGPHPSKSPWAVKRGQTLRRVAWLRSLLKRLDSLPILGDWRP